MKCSGRNAIPRKASGQNALRTVQPRRPNLMSLGRPRPALEFLPVPAVTGLISREQIQAYCQNLGAEFRPEKIVLFGSYAYGQPTSESDVDLLVILPFRGNDVAKAIRLRARFDVPFAIDLLVRKPQFIKARLMERDMFIESIMTQGVVLYEGQHP